MNLIKTKSEQLKTNLTNVAGENATATFKDFKSKGKIVLTAVTLIFLPVNTLIDQLLIKEIVTFWQVFVTTTPLTLGVMILAYSFFLNQEIRLSQVLIFGLLLAAGNFLGYATGLPGLEAIFDKSLFNISSWLVHLLFGYILTYGWQMIVSSLIIGIFLGWSWFKLKKL